MQEQTNDPVADSLFSKLRSIQPDEHTDDYLWIPIWKAWTAHQSSTSDESASKVVGRVLISSLMAIQRRYTLNEGREAIPILRYVTLPLKLEGMRFEIFKVLVGPVLAKDESSAFWAEWNDCPVF